MDFCLLCTKYYVEIEIRTYTESPVLKSMHYRARTESNDEDLVRILNYNCNKDHDIARINLNHTFDVS